MQTLLASLVLPFFGIVFIVLLAVGLWRVLRGRKPIERDKE